MSDSLFLTPLMLDEMRRDVARMLPDTAVLKTQTWTKDASGFQVSTQVAAGTVSCRLDSVKKTSDQVGLVAGREETRQMYRLTLPHDAPLDSDMVVEVASATYDIIEIEAAHSWNVSRRAIVARRQ